MNFASVLCSRIERDSSIREDLLIVSFNGARLLHDYTYEIL